MSNRLGKQQRQFATEELPLRDRIISMLFVIGLVVMLGGLVSAVRAVMPSSPAPTLETDAVVQL
jgi:hypothetical protein